MKFTAQSASAALLGLALLGGGLVSAQGQQGEVGRLRRENASLRESLVAVSKREEEAQKRLNEIELHLEAMGEGLLDGGEDRLVKAVSDREVMRRKLKELETAALGLSSSTRSYLTTAIAADPEARVEVETRLRDLDSAIGLREAPKPNRELGNLQQAQVVSVDSDSGVVVVNVGEKKSAVVGMPFEVFRNDNKVAEALIADTRDDVSALLVTRLENNANPVRRGDRVILKSN
jgi:hypothetical protein